MKTKKEFFKNSPRLFASGYKVMIMFVLLATLQTHAVQSQCKQLVWADEFNGANVDLSKWQSISGNGCPGLCGFGNSEAQKYDPNQATILKDGANSYLKIQAKYDADSPNEKFISAKLTTEGKFAIKYGRIEARMKLSSGLGAWPAFWMLPVNGSWPSTGEIDIMEAKHKNPKQIGGTIHYDAGGYHYTSKDYNSGQDLSQGFHVYAVEWGPDVIKWYLDNTLFHTVTPKTTTNGGWPFNNSNFFIILNLAVGSATTPYTSEKGVGTAPNPADFPTNLLIDYVRVYSGSYTFGIIGDAKVDANQANKNYSITSIPNAAYTWTVPTGATITAGQGTNAITVKWGQTGGNVTVKTTVASCTGGTTTNSYKLPVSAEANVSSGKMP
jgi:beta-glucanase (GH16 family)